MEFKTDPAHVHGARISAQSGDFGDEIAFDDHKIRFVMKYCRGKEVLDLGCTQHNPENYRSRYWLHKAIKEVASAVTGMDLYEDGVTFLNNAGYTVVHGDAQAFELNREFDVIVAGDLIEHLEDFHGFLESCKRHLRKDGRLLISTPNPWYWKNIVKAAANVEVSNNREHTCWLCVRTLRQLVARHGFEVGEIRFGSRYLRDRIMPLPRGWKHTSFHCELFVQRDHGV